MFEDLKAKFDLKTTADIVGGKYKEITIPIFETLKAKVQASSDTQGEIS